MNSSEKLLQAETNLEVMKLPNFYIQEERGVTLVSILLKAYNTNWGGHTNDLSNEVENFFKQNPLDEESIKFLEEKDIDEEMLYNIALTYGHHEREEELFDFIRKNKDCREDLKKLRDDLIIILQRIERILPDQLKEKLDEFIADDIEKRKQTIQEVQERIKKLIDFFNVVPQTTKVTTIVLLPTDFVSSEESGRAFQFGDELILHSHIDNPRNLEHEFLHSVINPIVDKLSEKLSEEQKQKIRKSASYRLKVEESYGEGFYSLLCEEFIRTYNDVIQRGEKPMTYEEFFQKISILDEKKFEELICKNEILKRRCKELEVGNLEELQNKSQAYFDKFERNELRVLIYNFYEKYIQEKEKDDKIIFEDFVLREFEKEL